MTANDNEKVENISLINSEGVTSDNGEVIDKETPLLSHPTKNRPKVWE